MKKIKIKVYSRKLYLFYVKFCENIMNQLIFIFIFTLFLVFCLTISAQVNENICPQIELTVPDKVLYPEQPATFSVKVKGDSQSSNLKYFWIFSGGKITKGQGDFKIEFTPNEEDNNLNLAVAVKVIGLPKPCSDTVSDFVSVAGLPIGEPVGNFRKDMRVNELTYLIDSFFTEIRNTPKSEGLVEVIFDKADSRNYKISLLKKIIKYLEFRKYDKARVTFAIKESDNENIVFWTMMPGSKFPESRDLGHKRISENSHQIIKAEEFEKKIKDLCLKNG